MATASPGCSFLRNRGNSRLTYTKSSRSTFSESPSGCQRSVSTKRTVAEAGRSVGAKLRLLRISGCEAAPTVGVARCSTIRDGERAWTALVEHDKIVLREIADRRALRIVSQDVQLDQTGRCVQRRRLTLLSLRCCGRHRDGN